MSRTELWEAPKGAPLTGHVAFTVDDDEHVRMPYTMLASILQNAGIRRKITTHHEPRLSLHPSDPDPSEPVARSVVPGGRPPPGYRWVTPRECHGSDQPCPRCAPDAPERRVAPTDGGR